ncbi:uncharacterized protein LAESUDRAFT_753891 [Laetiporus sulphureus 93-53]|uniref:Uncharacterized protein n=1 Tax=Laetiporus sulphureus 93-53 TaxID=1314785 RepID=A0A165IBJ4_9APHY|nr:uncharacterized protein LAESUDRAFT_753891 [Laetiporus sulphureus 93-53]KZT12851.1 hypothetical protein LAESUDRAFT_753891 [Laetiporus sulphureus 93-53]
MSCTLNTTPDEPGSAYTLQIHQFLLFLEAPSVEHVHVLTRSCPAVVEWNEWRRRVLSLLKLADTAHLELAWSRMQVPPTGTFGWVSELRALITSPLSHDHQSVSALLDQLLSLPPQSLNDVFHPNVPPSGAVIPTSSCTGQPSLAIHAPALELQDNDPDHMLHSEDFAGDDGQF